jgi:putative glutathione S-transferase
MWTTKLMIDGVWRGDVEETPEIAAKRAEHAAGFRGRIIKPEAGRYHLYVSYACPFAHRVILAYVLKRLHGIIGMSVVHPRWNTPDG